MNDKALLLVDDEPAIIRALQRELQPWAEANALDIVTASSAAEALGIIGRMADAICILLSDVRMPGGSGTDLVLKLHAEHPEVLCLLLTAHAELPELVKVVRGGAFSYILKPWEPDHLRAELEKALQLYRLREKDRAHRQRIDGDLRWAAELQQALFVAPLPSSAHATFSSCYLPLPEFGCGGDYYDVIEQGGGIFTMLVGDVAGHGVRAALVASFLKALVVGGLVDAPARRGTACPGALLSALNDRICGSVPGTQGMMITLAAASIDPARGELCIAAAGHPPAMLLRGGRARLLEMTTESIPLGAQRGAEFREKRYRLQNGDRLIMYTDGLVEIDGETFAAGTVRLARAAEALCAEDGLAAKLAVGMTPPNGYVDDVTVLTGSVTALSEAGGDGDEAGSPRGV